MDSGWNQILRRAACTQNYASWRYTPSMQVVERAIVAPQTELTVEHNLKSKFSNVIPIFNGGVYDSDGHIVEMALHQGMTGLRHVPDREPPEDPALVLDGSWLYGGFLFRHIGHMLTESVGRLWALDQERRDLNGIVFVSMNLSRNNGDTRTVADWVEQSAALTAGSPSLLQLFDLLGIKAPVHVVGPSARIERLEIPAQLMGLLPYGNLLGGHVVHRNYIETRVSRHVADRPACEIRRIFISRSKFYKPSAASISAEDVLDTCFSDHGYQVVQPDSLTLSEQVSIYRSASHIVLAAGSASHVVAMAMNGTQQVVVLRRYHGQVDQFTQQLLMMGARSADMVDVLAGRFLPARDEDRAGFGEPPASSIYMLDMRRLWDELHARGFC